MGSALDLAVDAQLTGKEQAVVAFDEQKVSQIALRLATYAVQYVGAFGVVIYTSVVYSVLKTKANLVLRLTLIVQVIS